MRKHAILLAALLAVGTATAGLAQPTTPETESTGVDVVIIEGYDFAMPKDEFVMTCVMGVSDTLDGRTNIEVVTVTRLPEEIVHSPRFRPRAVGLLATAQVGDCIGSADEILG